MPAQWITNTYKKGGDRKEYISRHLLGGVMTDLDGFDAFYKERRRGFVEVLNQEAPVAQAPRAFVARLAG